MQVTIFSFLSAVAWHSILIVIIYFIRRIDGLNLRFGMFVILALYLGGIVRIFFPLEFSYTIVVNSNTVYPALYRILHKEYFADSLIEGRVFSYLIFIWIFVATILLLRYFLQYILVSRKIMETTTPCSGRVEKTMETIREQTGRYIDVDILICSDMAIPFGLGLFKRKILLPDKNYVDKDLYYILRHEYTHFINKDILIKILISTFCIAFWWNPLAYLLKRDLEQAQEIKCDLSIVKNLTVEEKADYLESIRNVLKGVPAGLKVPTMSTALLKNGNGIEIKERFNRVMNYKPTLEYQVINIVFILIFTLLVAVSYAFVLQPTFESPIQTDGVGVFDINRTDSYLKETEDGQYELFIKNESHGVITKESATMFIEDGFPIL